MFLILELVTALKHPVLMHVIELWLYNVWLFCSSVRCQCISSPFLNTTHPLFSSVFRFEKSFPVPLLSFYKLYIFINYRKMPRPLQPYKKRKKWIFFVSLSRGGQKLVSRCAKILQIFLAILLFLVLKYLAVIFFWQYERCAYESAINSRMRINV